MVNNHEVVLFCTSRVQCPLNDRLLLPSLYLLDSSYGLDWWWYGELYINLFPDAVHSLLLAGKDGIWYSEFHNYKSSRLWCLWCISSSSSLQIPNTSLLHTWRCHFSQGFVGRSIWSMGSFRGQLKFGIHFTQLHHFFDVFDDAWHNRNSLASSRHVVSSWWHVSRDDSTCAVLQE